jgi:hypothetical protein
MDTVLAVAPIPLPQRQPARAAAAPGGISPAAAVRGARKLFRHSDGEEGLANAVGAAAAPASASLAGVGGADDDAAAASDVPAAVSALLYKAAQGSVTGVSPQFALLFSRSGDSLRDWARQQRPSGGPSASGAAGPRGPPTQGLLAAAHYDSTSDGER